MSVIGARLWGRSSTITGIGGPNAATLAWAFASVIGPGFTSQTSSKPRLTTRMLSSTTRAPFAPNLCCSWLLIASISVASSRPACAITGEAAKKAPWKAMPCMRSCRSESVASSRAILNPSM
jgi:hypothetical protein